METTKMKTDVKLYLSLGFIVGFCFIALGCGSESNDNAESDSTRIALAQIDGNSDGTTDFTVKYSYNNLGQLTEKKYDAGYYATTESYLQYFYDDKGFLEEEVLIDAEGNVIRRTIYHYDDSCFRSDLDRVIGDSYGTESVTVYCDDNGNIRLRQFDYDEDPMIDEEVEYSVDEFGNITSETHYDENGDELDALYRSYHNGYDDDGNLLSRTGYSFNDIIFFKSTYTYLDGKIRSWEFARFTGGEYDSTSIVHYIYE
jgi:hypothetical protein